MLIEQKRYAGSMISGGLTFRYKYLGRLHALVVLVWWPYEIAASG